MKYALVDGQRREARPSLAGTCPGCGDAMVAKCGNFTVPHWAHRSKRHCDHWWEPETEWHRAWKNQFPADWQEVRQQAEDGEWHIADIKTAHGTVIEIQHSRLPDDERVAREAFYRPMDWIVNGQRLKTDKPRLFKALGHAQVVNFKPFTFSVPSNKYSVLRDWADSRVAVLIDFGDSSELEDIFHFDGPVLWRLDPKSPNGLALVSPVYQADFIEALRNGRSYKGMDAREVIKPDPLAQLPPSPPRPHSFEQYMARKRRARSRRRL